MGHILVIYQAPSASFHRISRRATRYMVGAGVGETSWDLPKEMNGRRALNSTLFLNSAAQITPEMICISI